MAEYTHTSGSVSGTIFASRLSRSSSAIRLRFPTQALPRSQLSALRSVRGRGVAEAQKARLSPARRQRGVGAGAIAASVLVTGAAYVGLAYASTSLPEDVHSKYTAPPAMQPGRDMIALFAGH